MKRRGKRVSTALCSDWGPVALSSSSAFPELGGSRGSGGGCSLKACQSAAAGLDQAGLGCRLPAESRSAGPGTSWCLFFSRSWEFTPCIREIGKEETNTRLHWSFYGPVLEEIEDLIYLVYYCIPSTKCNALTP
ncbi:uncharacterized protein LOC144615946 [Panthera onca]